MSSAARNALAHARNSEFSSPSAPPVRSCEDGMSRKFGVSYDEASASVRPDRAIQRGPYVVTMQTG